MNAIDTGLPRSTETAAEEVVSDFSKVVDLQTLVNWSLQDHPLIRSARAEVSAAKADLEQSRWQFYPAPYVRADAYKGRSAWVAGVRQSLWTGGRLRSDVDAAEAAELAAGKSLHQVQHEIARRVASIWLQVMTAKDLRKVALEGHEQLLELQAMMERRVMAGYSPPVDLNQVQARVSQSRSDVDRMQAQVDAALHELELVTGRSIELDQIGAIAKSPYRSVVTKGEAMRMLERSPAWQKALADVEVARARLAQVAKQNTPTIEARVEYH